MQAQSQLQRDKTAVVIRRAAALRDIEILPGKLTASFKRLPVRQLNTATSLVLVIVLKAAWLLLS